MAYLDHAATTPMYVEAIAAMTAQLSGTGNASSLHASGRRARRVVEESREQLAASLGARPSEVVFTASGTEADNLAVKGLYWARRAGDVRRRRVLASTVEHHAVMDPVLWLAEHEGAEISWLAVDARGRLDIDAFRTAVERNPDDVALVSVMSANNEVGTVQPLDEVVAIAHALGIPVHADAIQAVGTLPVDFAASGIDAMSVAAHKIGGPLGVGALLVGRDVDVAALIHGGGQERDIRSGTLDTPAVAGFAAAGEVATRSVAAYADRVAALRDQLITVVFDAVPDAVLNGADPGPGRLPGNAHFSFPGCEGDSLLMLLDARGVEVSTGSACSAGVPRASHVLLAMGVDEQLARASLRFSLGHTSTPADVSALAQALGPVVERARAAGLASVRG